MYLINVYMTWNSFGVASKECWLALSKPWHPGSSYSSNIFIRLYYLLPDLKLLSFFNGISSNWAFLDFTVTIPLSTSPGMAIPAPKPIIWPTSQMSVTWPPRSVNRWSASTLSIPPAWKCVTHSAVGLLYGDTVWYSRHNTVYLPDLLPVSLGLLSLNPPSGMHLFGP